MNDVSVLLVLDLYEALSGIMPALWRRVRRDGHRRGLSE